MKQSRRTYYTCPRCNHSTANKADIRRHFLKQRTCPNENALTLTQDIIDTVLKDHVFHSEKIDDNVNKFNLIINGTEIKVNGQTLVLTVPSTN